MATAEQESVVAQVIRMLEGQVGTGNIHATDLAESLGIGRPQAMSAVGSIRSRDQLGDLEVLMVGNGIYRVVPKIGRNGKAGKTPSRRMFEEIGSARDGTLIIQSDSGDFYKATPI